MTQGRDRHDARTGDLLAWEPQQLVTRFDDHRVRTSTLRARIARAVSETLTDSERTRQDIAENMSIWLGEEVTKNMLDAYASEARSDHTIPFLRLLALVHVTGDLRLMQLGSDLFEHSVIDNRYLTWVEVGQLADKKDELEKSFEAARRNARKGSRP